jgi:hypothetical protein
VVPRVDELRIFAEGQAHVEGEAFVFESTSSNHEPINIAVTLRMDGGTTARFWIPEAAPLSLRQQVYFHRILRFIAKGGRLGLEFLDPPHTKGTAETQGNQDLVDTDEVLESLNRLDELQSRLGQELPAVDIVSAKDDAITSWALALIKEGEAPGIWNGRIRMTGTREMAEQLERSADADRRMTIRYEMEHLTIRLDSGIEFDLGTVEHSIAGAILEGPEETEPGVFEAELAYETSTPQTVRRLLRQA